MSGLIDAVGAAMTPGAPDAYPNRARVAVLAVADWLDENTGEYAAKLLRAEVAQPPPPTAEDVIREALIQSGLKTFTATHALRIATCLRDVGLLREDTP